MEKPARRTASPRLRLQALQAQVVALNQRVEDLEDLRELNQAIERQGNKPLLRWSKAKQELDLA